MSNIVTVDFRQNNKKAVKPEKMLQDSWVMVGSKGSILDMETALNAYSRSLGYAAMTGQEEEFKKQLVGMHYSNGLLSVFWENASKAEDLRQFVDYAWEDQGEMITHFSYSGAEV